MLGLEEFSNQFFFVYEKPVPQLWSTGFFLGIAYWHLHHPCKIVTLPRISIGHFKRMIDFINVFCLKTKNITYTLIDLLYAMWYN